MDKFNESTSLLLENNNQETMTGEFPQHIGCKGVVLNVDHEGVPPTNSPIVA